MFGAGRGVVRGGGGVERREGKGAVPPIMTVMTKYGLNITVSNLPIVVRVREHNLTISFTPHFDFSFGCKNNLRGKCSPEDKEFLLGEGPSDDVCSKD